MTHKKIISSMILLPILLSENSFGAGKPIFNSSNEPIATFNHNGNISDHSGPDSVSISSSGIITDSSNTPVGKINTNGNIYYENRGNIGNITSSGAVLSSDNTPIGYVDTDGNVINSIGAHIAKVPDPRIGALILLHVLNLK